MMVARSACSLGVVALLLATAVLSSCGRSGAVDWPPRTSNHESTAASIPAATSLTMVIPDSAAITFTGTMVPKDGVWVPFPCLVDLGGTLETAVGEERHSARVVAEALVYDGPQMKRAVGWAPVLMSGSLLVPDIFAELRVPDVYVDNEFHADSVGDRFTLITFPVDSHLALLPQDDGSLLLTAACPGTRVHFGDGNVYERRSDGWYLEGRRVRSLASEPLELLDPPSGASEYQIVDGLLLDEQDRHRDLGRYQLTGLISGSGSVKQYDGRTWVYGELLRVVDSASISGAVTLEVGSRGDGPTVTQRRNDSAECDTRLPRTGFVGVVGGMYNSLGLRGDGSMAVWGADYSGMRDVPSPNTGFLGIAAGEGYGLGLKDDGSIVAWGDNDYGRCDVPAPNREYMSVAAAYEHSLGLKRDGSIVAWGRNNCGQCNVPSPNAGFIGVAAGWCHSLGLKRDGSVVAWGKNNYGQCNVPSPNGGFIGIAAGSYHSLGLKGDGSIVAWGVNVTGQCNVPSPNTGFTAVAAGSNHSLALKGDGSIIAWGNNDNGECAVPLPNTGFVAIAAGGSHSLGLRGDGSIAAWGSNDHGECDVP